MGDPHDKPGAKRRRGVPFAKGADPRRGKGPAPGFSTAIRAVVGNDPTRLARIALAIAEGKLSIDTVKVMKLNRGGDAGDEIVDHPIKEIPSHTERLAALTFLRDSGWGQPSKKLEVEVTERDKIAAQFEAMTAEQLEAEILQSIKPPETH